MNAVTFDFAGADVLVTGGTSGIGHSIARAFADARATVTVTGTRPLAGDYEVDLADFTYRQCEMTDVGHIDRLFDDVDRLDVLVNNAGANLPRGRDEYESDVFAESIMINLIGLQRLTSRARPMLAASSLDGGASVINLASMAALFGVAMVPGYAAAKSGVVGLTRTLAVAWAADGIRVNAVAPGVIETPMTAPMMGIDALTAPMLARTPAGRFGTARDVAPTVLFLASSSAAYITGQTWCVDGGFSIAG